MALRPAIRSPSVVPLALVAIVAAGCSGGTVGATASTSTGSPPAASTSTGSTPTASAAVKTVTLAAAGSSGVSGTATLTDAGGGQTQVVISVEANSNPDMPGAISLGTCTAIDESTLYHLNDTRKGSSTSVVPVSLADLTARPFIIHIHTAPDEPSLAACGEIR
jgi:hypothetical protein